MGIYASFQFFGAFLGGLISGILNGWLGPKLALVACLIFIVIAMIIVWGLQKATKAKRITLSIENTNVLLQGVNQMQLKSQLQKLNGVQEVLIDVEKNAVYLKIDNTGFDIEKAKSLIK